MIFILLTATVLLMDLGIKFTIENADPSLFPRTIEKTKGLIMLHRNHNEGFPFGALKEKKELFEKFSGSVNRVIDIKAEKSEALEEKYECTD